MVAERNSFHDDINPARNSKMGMDLSHFISHFLSNKVRGTVVSAGFSP